MVHNDIFSLLTNHYLSRMPLSETLNDNHIRELVQHSDAELRELTAKALVFDTGNNKTVGYLIQLSKDLNTDVRIEAIDSLSAYPCKESFLALCSAISDEHDLIRAYAVYGVAVTGRIVSPAEALTILRGIEKSELSSLVRVSIYEGLYTLGDYSVLKKLIQIFYTDEYHVQCNVLRALANIADSENKTVLSQFVDNLGVGDYPLAVTDALSELTVILSSI